MKTLQEKSRQRIETTQRIKTAFIRWVVSIRWKIFLLFLSLLGCGPSEIKPIDIYPEDMCSQCRMAISQQAFAAEIITKAEEVFKFDDLGCLERFKEKSSALEIAAVFVKDYQTKAWLPFERSVIVQTSLQTPMGSGKIALTDSQQAGEFLRQNHPKVKTEK
jgi:copper chaperone NosL